MRRHILRVSQRAAAQAKPHHEPPCEHKLHAAHEALSEAWHAAAASCIDYRNFSADEVATCLHALSRVRAELNSPTLGEVYRQLLQQASRTPADIALPDLPHILRAARLDTHSRHTRIVSRATELLRTTPLHSRNSTSHIDTLHQLSLLRVALPSTVWDGVAAHLLQGHANPTPPLVMKALRAAHEQRQDTLAARLTRLLARAGVLSESPTTEVMWLLRLGEGDAGSFLRAELLRQLQLRLPADSPRSLTPAQLVGAVQHTAAWGAEARAFHAAALQASLACLRRLEGTLLATLLVSFAESRTTSRRFEKAVQNALFTAAGSLGAQPTSQALRGLRLLAVGANPRLFALLHRQACAALRCPHATPYAKVGVLLESRDIPHGSAVLRHLQGGDLRRMNLAELASVMRCFSHHNLRDPRESQGCVDAAAALLQSGRADAAPLCSIVHSMKLLNLADSTRLSTSGAAVVERLALEASFEGEQLGTQTYVVLLKLVASVPRLEARLKLEALLAHLPAVAPRMGVRQLCSAIDTLAAWGGAHEGSVRLLLRCLVSALGPEAPLSSEVEERLRGNLAKAGVTDEVYDGYRDAIRRG